MFDFDTRIRMWCTDLLRAHSDKGSLSRCNTTDEHNISTVYFDEKEREFIHNICGMSLMQQCTSHHLAPIIIDKFGLPKNFHKSTDIRKKIKAFNA
jgi:hypothetical protein